TGSGNGDRPERQSQDGGRLARGARMTNGSRARRPVVAITVGDPSGIGPEIALAASTDARVLAVCDPVIYGPTDAASLAAFPCGTVDAASGRTAYDLIVGATADAMAGKVDAIATAPVNKAAFAAAGLTWKGHTDLLRSEEH